MAAGAALAGPASASAAPPEIQAHRGGPVVDGVPTYPESSMPGFRASAKKGFVLEFDVRLTSDGVPVVMHDPTLDRTTDCEGRVNATTRAELAECRIDILGTEVKFRRLGPRDRRRAAVPTLAGALRFIARSRASASIELANYPGEEGFDASGAPAATMAETIAASDVRPRRLVLQSFWPSNLQAASEVLPNVAQSYLTQSQSNDAGPSIAESLGAEWFSPAWPIDAALVEEAHALGQLVVPYTIDARRGIRAAAALGVDAVITNDPTLARRALRR
ncbi:hypothetical protein HJD18_13380 [Thermoleophilia bacterium SCSIO 60948]|nr:hypothetical protein HJD18_13380 [Thermoleophilia bacterium SCSIO 60948]